MLKSNNFSYYLICKLSLVNIKIPSFSFLKKAILGLHKNLFWHISRKIGKILKKFQKAPLKALLNQEKIFSKRLLKMHSFHKKKLFEKNECPPFRPDSVIPITPQMTQRTKNSVWQLCDTGEGQDVILWL